MKIAVVAMGKIGLPLAVQFAEKGHDVIGVDHALHKAVHRLYELIPDRQYGGYPQQL